MDTEALKRSLLSKFVEVTQDRLQAIQLGVLALERPEAEKASEEIARELHTMKGEARMLGLAAVGQLAHAAEDVLKAQRDGRLEVRAATDLLLHACDAIADLLENLDAAKDGDAASQDMGRRLSQASGVELPPLRPAAPKAAAPRPAPGAGGRRPALPPAAPPPRAEAASRDVPRAGAGAAGTDGDRPGPADRSIRVNVDTLDALGLLAGDLLVESARAGLRGAEIERLFERFSRLADGLLRLADGRRLPPELKRVVDRAESDLHLLRDDAFRFVRGHSDGLDTLHNALTQLADHVAEARLVPLATVFEAFPRAVRELANAQGKRVEVVLEKTNAGVDRNMVSDVRDALVHLIRNASDHGIEAPEARLALGKSEQGQIRLRARADGDLLSVQVEDDGRGIDPARLRAVAVQRGLLTEAQAAALGERESIELIFRAGFSTREQVSEVSGRGVGMDVVRRKIESLGGSVSVSSRPGRGTTISLRLPQSLALMRVLLVRLGDDVYGLPAADVEAVARFRPEDRLEVLGGVAVMHRGAPVAMAALGPLLGLNGGPRFDRPPCVVVRHGEDRAALAVDGFVDEREVAVKSIGGSFLKGAPFVSGSAALEDGRMAVLLRVPDIMAEVRRLARPVSEAPSSRRLRVLVVDDSPIARATQSALVRALGHAVEEAHDGEDGWDRLVAGSFDLVLTDVQMPRLEGFGLTRRIKQTPSLARIPVIILTSLASPEDKRRGLDAGADAYLVKGELGIESLAMTIGRLT